MSYEYKEIIKSRVYEPNALPLYWEAQNRGVGAHIVIKDALKELDHVYAQAAEYKEYRADTEKLYNALKAKGEKEILKYKAKADEYEAKAKAWDKTQELLKECTHQTPGDDYEVDWHEFEIKIDEVISDYESGESNA